MRCVDCGVENETVKVYKTACIMSFEEKDIFEAKFEKALCSGCLTGNVYSLVGELNFLAKEEPTIKEKLRVYIDNTVIVAP